MKKYAFGALLLCVFLLISLTGCGGRSGDYSSHIPDPTDTFYVLDTAGVMSSETRNYIVRHVVMEVACKRMAVVR